MRPFLVIITLILSPVLFAQSLTGTIRGKVVDKNTEEPLIGVLVAATLDQKTQNRITDETGSFRIENVPVGRYTIRFSYLGYEEAVVTQLEATSSKQVVLDIAMEEKITTSSTIVVRARKDKAKNYQSDGIGKWSHL